jgi:hypothetical protein
MANPDQIEVQYGSLHLLMEMVNIDTLYYSLAMKTRCHFQDRFAFQDAELWFRVEALEQFIGALGALAQGQGDAALPEQGAVALLHDVHQRFAIRLTRDGAALRCEVSAHYEGSPEGEAAALMCSFPADASFAALLRDTFREFPKWW